MKRTGSISSLVPPALTTTRRPCRSGAIPAAPLASTRTAVCHSSAGSGRRPGPLSAPVSRPDAGSSTRQPRSVSVATLAWVAGCSHISVCMAGAMTTGQRAVSSTLVSRSSAWPVAARARRSAVAGATTTRSACWPIRACGTSVMSLHTSVCTGLPDSADQVAAPTKCRADAVGTTVTSWPPSVSSRRSEQDLYAAMPPANPRTTLTRSLLGGSGGQQPLVDLAQRDGHRLLVHLGVDQRADVLEQALLELGVVGVDLPGPLRRVEDEGVLGVRTLQQLVDRRVGDADGIGLGSGHASVSLRFGYG